MGVWFSCVLIRVACRFVCSRACRRFVFTSFFRSRAGLLNKETVVTSRIPCGVAHPGLCPADPPDVFDKAMRILHNAEAHIIKDYSMHDYIQLIRVPAFDSDVFARIGYIRLSNPRDVVVMRAQHHDDVDLRRSHIPRTTRNRNGSSIAVRPEMLSALIADAVKDCALVSLKMARVIVRRMRDRASYVEILEIGDGVEAFDVADGTFVKRRARADPDPMQTIFDSMFRGGRSIAEDEEKVFADFVKEKQVKVVPHDDVSSEDDGEIMCKPMGSAIAIAYVVMSCTVFSNVMYQYVCEVICFR